MRRVRRLARPLAWAVLSLFLAGVFLATDSIQGFPLRPGYLLVLGAVCSALWLAAAPVIWACVGRFPLTRPRLVQHAALHLALAILFAFALTSLFALGMWLLQRAWYTPRYTLGSAFRSAVYYFLLAKLLFYALVVTARRASDESARTAKIEAELVRARLDALRMQMNPHFLFNALNSVSGLVRARETEPALSMLARLGDVLRRSLAEEDRPDAPLEAELDALDEVLEIERCRFGERLRFRTEIPDELLSVSIPRWILQPLVENAVRHGLEASADASEITLRVRGEDGVLTLELDDDGLGPQSDPDGIGLGNTRSRLSALYGDQASVCVTARPVRGTRVTLRLPLERRVER